MKRIISLSIVILSCFATSAQQDAMFTHYRYNTIAVNPAYAGNRGVLSTTLLHRSQWVGVDGAPMTQTLTINTPLWDNKLGLGVSLVNDVIGPVKAFSGKVDIAYRLQLSRTQRLIFGVKGGITNYNRQLQSLETSENNDTYIEGSLIQKTLLNFGTGILYMDKNFYAGLAVPRLLENDFENPLGTTNNLIGSERRHFFITAGTALDLTNSIELKPSTFIKVTSGAPIEVDLTGMFVFNQKFELGAMWRTSDALGLLVGLNLKDNFRIGYSFDWSYAYRTFNYNSGSHEVMLRYDLRFNGGEDILSPRYF